MCVTATDYVCTFIDYMQFICTVPLKGAFIMQFIIIIISSSSINNKVKSVRELTDWDKVIPSISTAGTCCMGLSALY